MALTRVIYDSVRCSEDLEGLREQGVTNQICAKFIIHYDRLFDCPPEMSPYTLRVLDVDTMDQSSPRLIQVGNFQFFS